MRNPRQAKNPSGAGGFWIATAKWSVGLVLLLFLFQLLNGAYPWGTGRVWTWIQVILGNFGLLLPPAAFAGGLATLRSLRPRGVLTRACLLCLFSFVVLGYGLPMAEYRAHADRDIDLAEYHPFGPETPGALIELRRAVRANPPAEYTYRVGQPFTIPPNWLTTLLHGPVAVSLFALLAALLGRSVGLLTTGLSPPVSRHVRWAAGLAVAVSFYVPMMVASDWVRQNLTNSGLVATYGPMLIPLMTLAVLGAVLRSRQVGSALNDEPAEE